MKSFDNAKEAYEKAAIIEPSDPEVPYAIGVIDWTIAYQRRMEERNKIGLKPTDNLPPGEPCDRLRAQNSTFIEDGISHFLHALELRHDYDDAMAYANLIYRERADLECNDSALRENDLKTADSRVDRTMMVKKRKQENKQPCGFQDGEIDPCFNSND